MFITIEAHEYKKYEALLTQMLRVRKQVFADQLGWDVVVQDGIERDIYDDCSPVYLIWCDSTATQFYGGMRLMPTTGPTLLYDVFRRTFPEDVDLVAPGIWEGTRMCVDADALAKDYPDMTQGDAFSIMLLALCECALQHGIHTMLSNYEPHMKRIYRRAGIVVNELGRAEGYGRLPVCCGSFEVSKLVLERIRKALCIHESIYTKRKPALAASISEAA